MGGVVRERLCGDEGQDWQRQNTDNATRTHDRAKDAMSITIQGCRESGRRLANRSTVIAISPITMLSPVGPKDPSNSRASWNQSPSHASRTAPVIQFISDSS
jgi:hypothetical protein